MKQNMKSQASTQDSLRAAVSHLDKQVQVLPSTLAKQLAQPTEQSEALPKTKSEASSQQQKQQAQQADVAEKQLTSWSEALEQQSDSEATLAARAAFLQDQPHQQQQQQVPLSRRLMEEAPHKSATSPAAPGLSPRQQQQQEQQPAVTAPTAAAAAVSAAETAAPQANIVQVMNSPPRLFACADLCCNASDCLSTIYFIILRQSCSIYYHSLPPKIVFVHAVSR